MIRALSLPLPAHSITIFSTLSHMANVARSRAALARLDQSALQDVGLTEKEAFVEANRAFWDAPENWRI